MKRTERMAAKHRIGYRSPCAFCTHTDFSSPYNAQDAWVAIFPLGLRYIPFFLSIYIHREYFVGCG